MSAGACSGSRSLSLCVCTRDRAADLRRSLPSFVSNLTDLAEIIVVDQSSDDETSRVVAEFHERHPELRYVRCRDRGLSRARNLALSLATAPLVGYTDDDCLLPDGWARSMAEQLRPERVGAVFGAVVAEAFDRRLGHTPEFPDPPAVVLTAARPAAIPPVMGANMAFRRRVLELIGGFDPVLGAGAPLRSAEDLDAAYRVLLRGYEVVVSPAPAVVHFGFRTFASGASGAMIRSGHLGLGAYFAKHLRAADWRMAPAALDALRRSTRFVWANWRRGQRPLGLGRVAYTLLGMARSARYRLDRDLRVLKPSSTRGAPGPAAPALRDV